MTYDADEVIQEHVARIDWDKVAQSEAAELGLSLGILRDAGQAHALRWAAWGTAVGGALSTSVLALVALRASHQASTALAVVMCAQAVRGMLLWWKQAQAQRLVSFMEKDVIDTAKLLALKHPLPRLCSSERP